VDILHELFTSPGAYEPPPQARDVLARVAADRPLRVLDLGGNIGLFAVDTFVRYGGAHVTSYEPHPENLQVLTHCVDLNATEHWAVVPACAAPADGRLRLSDEFADAYVSDIGTEVVAVDVLPLLYGFDYVKMDIEGSEWPILDDPRWAAALGGVSVLVLEWHRRGCPVSEARSRAIAAVNSAGFACDPGVPGHHHGTIWGWR
jgi:FkbM family methyltransferase